MGCERVDGATRGRMFVRISQLPRSISHLVTSGHLRHRVPTRVYVRYVRQSADKEGKALVPTSQAIGLRLQGSTMRGDWLRSMKCQLTIASLRVGRTQSVSIEMLGHNVKATAEPLYAAEKEIDESFHVKKMRAILLIDRRSFANISDSDRDQQFYLHGGIFLITSINFASCPTLFRLAKCAVEHRSDLAPAAVHAVETHVLAVRIWRIKIRNRESRNIMITIVPSISWSATNLATELNRNDLENISRRNDFSTVPR
ncbi:hypothetical protein ALC57_04319 [Trachymyrmex cornetzi]|uniref:Uncharacterized protein n=1 Tax=Trachymyrmex cornetzi TaxID=471704 RepID=A0A195EDZ1_9HYME|nr:hypothetical protein ALC57_04319 [Trachymyrmex cornetzi]